jgi:ubiquinone/menaquinone biosynthesis C-methylase UbiE
VKDFFGPVAGDYAKYRPAYPSALFDRLAGLAPAGRVAWDCATGNGQAALGLTAHYALVVASDASARQIAAARRHPRVRYVLARGETPPLASHSVALVTIAQALHWLDTGALWPEVTRVLVPGGVVGAWCYNLCRISPDIDRVIEDFYRVSVGPYWTPERRPLEEGYRTLPFPFDEVDVEPPEMSAPLLLDAMVRYVGTWSAVERYRADRGVDPTRELRERLAPLWGAPEVPRLVHWPLSLRVGRTQGAW